MTTEASAAAAQMTDDDLRADPEAACQNMLVVHEQHGVISHQELHLGHPSEGSLYAGPAVVSRPYADVA